MTLSVLLTVVILGGGWYGLFVVVRRYNPVPGRRHRFGQVLQRASLLTAIGALIGRLNLRTDHCGRVVGAAAAIEDWLFLLTVVLFMLGVVLSVQGAEWVAIAAVAVADFGLVPITYFPHSAYPVTIPVVLCVHGGCTTVAAWWSRRLRGGGPDARAKAAEAGRILAGGWLAFLLLLVAAIGASLKDVLPNTTLLGLFVVAAIATVTGAGYTKYAEARTTITPPPEQDARPAPDSLDQLATRIREWASRVRDWHCAYRECF